MPSILDLIAMVAFAAVALSMVRGLVWSIDSRLLRAALRRRPGRGMLVSQLLVLSLTLWLLQGYGSLGWSLAGCTATAAVLMFAATGVLLAQLVLSDLRETFLPVLSRFYNLGEAPRWQRDGEWEESLEWVTRQCREQRRCADSVEPCGASATRPKRRVDLQRTGPRH